MSIVVATKTTEFALEMGGSHDFYKTVSVPGYFQTFSANRTASFPVENFTLGAAADGNTLLLATLCLAFHTSTDGAVDRRPHLSIPENLVAKLAHFDVFLGHS